MSFNKKIPEDHAATINTGFGTNASNYGGRFLLKDGTPNIRKTGVGILERFSWYHSMLSFSNLKFFFIIIGYYIGINLVFTMLYYAIGTSHLNGLHTHSGTDLFWETFFFSTQTFTTVGYGRINPIGITAGAAASFEALFGLMSFALVTGLLYGRFSRARAYLKFSDKALISPYKNISALMLRAAPFKNTVLTDAEAKLTLILVSEVDGKAANRFFNLDLELTLINSFTLSWTLVHPITADSPLYDYSKENLENTRGELIVYIKAFDDKFSNTVITRTSYTFDEIVFGAKFIPMFHRDEALQTTVLDLNKLNSFEKATLPLKAEL